MTTPRPLEAPLLPNPQEMDSQTNESKSSVTLNRSRLFTPPSRDSDEDCCCTANTSTNYQSDCCDDEASCCVIM